jgi:hypothetical protein
MRPSSPANDFPNYSHFDSPVAEMIDVDDDLNVKSSKSVTHNTLAKFLKKPPPAAGIQSQSLPQRCLPRLANKKLPGKSLEKPQSAEQAVNYITAQAPC